MRDRHMFAIDGVFRVPGRRIGSEMRDDLMSVEVEIDPMLCASAFRASQQPAVEGSRRGKVVDREGEMEGRNAHEPRLNFSGASRNQGPARLVGPAVWRIMPGGSADHYSASKRLLLGVRTG